MVATGLLIAMAGLYVTVRSCEGPHPAWGFVRAFAEAGMIGGLADWFAVVALFRHPLGLPIWHTAVIARSKDQIADNLARFVEENFLGPVRITARLAKLQLAGKLAVWLGRAENSARVAHAVAAALPGVIDALDDHDMRRFVRDNLTSIGEKIPLALLGAKMLTALSGTGYDVQLLEQGLRLTKTLLHDNLGMVEERIAAELEKVPGLFGLKAMFVKKTAHKVVNNIQGSLDAVLADTEHPLRHQFQDKVRGFAEDLASSSEWHERAESLKQELLSHQVLLGAVESLWDAFKRELIEDLARRDSWVRDRLTSALSDLGKGLARDEAFREKLDTWILQAAGHFVKSHGHEIGNLIRDTVHKWDGREMAAKLEEQVGPDLQRIRISGTIVGGLVGLALHALSGWIW